MISRQGLLSNPAVLDPLTHSDMLSLAKYLLNSLPPLPLKDPSPLISETKLPKPKVHLQKIGKAKEHSPSNSTWKKALSLGSLGGYLGMPGSSAAVAQRETETAPTDTQERTTTKEVREQSLQQTAKGWLPNMPIFGNAKRKSVGTPPNTPSAAKLDWDTAKEADNTRDQPRQTAADIGTVGEILGAAPQEALQSVDSADAVGHNANVQQGDDLGSATSITPVGYLQAIQDALSEELQAETGKPESTSTTEAHTESGTRCEVREPTQIYVGEQGEWVQMQSFTVRPARFVCLNID